MSNPSNNNNNNNNNVGNPIVGENCIVLINNTTTKLSITTGENGAGYLKCYNNTNDTISSQRNSNVKLIISSTEKTKQIITHWKNKLNKRRESSETVQKKLNIMLENRFVEEVAGGQYREVQVNEEGNIVGEQTTPPTQNNQGNVGGSSNNGAVGNNNNAGGGGAGGNNNNAGGGGDAEEEDAEEVINVPDLDDPEYYAKLLSSNQARGDNIEEQYKEEQKVAKMRANERFTELDTKSADAVASKLEHDYNQKLEEKNDWLCGKTEEYDQENNKLQNCNKTLQDTINDENMDAGERDGLVTLLGKRKTSLIQNKKALEDEVGQVREAMVNELKSRWSEQKDRLQIGNDWGETPQGAKRKFYETIDSVKLWISLDEDENEEDENEEDEDEEDEQFEQFDNTEAAVYH